jgi:hypothetical protein
VFLGGLALTVNVTMKKKTMNKRMKAQGIRMACRRTGSQRSRHRVGDGLG